MPARPTRSGIAPVSRMATPGWVFHSPTPSLRCVKNGGLHPLIQLVPLGPRRTESLGQHRPRSRLRHLEQGRHIRGPTYMADVPCGPSVGPVDCAGGPPGPAGWSSSAGGACCPAGGPSGTAGGPSAAGGSPCTSGGCSPPWGPVFLSRCWLGPPFWPRRWRGLLRGPIESGVPAGNLLLWTHHAQRPGHDSFPLLLEPFVEVVEQLVC
jgi:hypothetical protein